MKKLSISLTLISIIAMSTDALAIVPVFIDGDAPAMMNQIETMTKWAAQYKQMVEQITQAKQQYAAVTGSRGLGNILNDPAIQSTLPADWKNVLASIKTTPLYAQERAKYPTTTASPKLNVLYDTLAAQNATISDFYNKANGRLKQSQALMGLIDLAADPAAKDDLRNRLISEQNSIAATNQMLGLLQQKNQQEMEAASHAAYLEYECKEFKRKGC